MSLKEAKKRIALVKEMGAVELDLSKCGLTFPPKELLTISDQLSSLNLSENSIVEKEWAAFVQIFKNLSFLDISSNEIEDDGIIILSSCLKNLSKLVVANNKFGSEGAIAIGQNIKKLSYLDISYNDIGDQGVKTVAQNLKNLVSLNVHQNNIGIEGTKAIAKNLRNLIFLNIGENKIDNESAILISQNLFSLSDLHIDSTIIDDDGVVILTENLDKLSSLDISNNDIDLKGIQAIGQNLVNLTTLNIGNTGGGGDEGVDFLCKRLKNLKHLKIYCNDISDNGAKTISEDLKNLISLDIGENEIGDNGIIHISQNLRDLTSLEVYNNNIGDDGAISVIQNLKYLNYLDVSHNKIDDAGIKMLYDTYKSNLSIEIYLMGNSPQSIPTSAIESWEGLKEYFLSIYDKETIFLGALNVLLLGNTFTGKSSLQDFYLDGTFQEKSKKDRTWGIVHKTINSKIAPNLRLSFWDFGGQEYFHGTHQLFIGGRNSLYLVLWESQFEEDGKEIENGCEKMLMNEIDDVCYPASYWLGTIRHFEQQASISERTILIQSKIDVPGNKNRRWPAFLANIRFEIQSENCFSLSTRGASRSGDQDTKKYYETLWAVFKIRFEQLICKLQSRYEFNVEMLKILGKDGLIQWRKDEGLYVSKEHFLKLCGRFYSGGDTFIIQYLQDCGEILIFDKSDVLKNIIFINPERLLNNIYAVLNEQVRAKGGIFSIDDIKYILDKRALLDVMIEMDLVFKNPARENEFVAPQFMNANDDVFKLLGHLRRLLKVEFAIRFPDFMPRSCITRFIAQKGKLSVDGIYWKFGVLYNHVTATSETLKVLVEADENNRIVRIYADDKPGKYEALIDVFRQFAFRGYPNAITADVTAEGSKNTKENEKRLKDAWLIEPLELSADGQNFATIAEINEAINQGSGKVKDTKGSYLPINSIFHVLLNKAKTVPKKIFFSYSRYDRQYRDEFEVHFAVLKRQGLVASWYDGEIEPGADANADIMKELNQADIILCLLSPQFMANDYIWKIEMDKARAGKKVIVPITVKACDYKKYFAEYFGEDKQSFLSQKQFDPGQMTKTLRRDIIWIASEQNLAKRDEYYNFIVEGLKKIIDK